MKYGDLIQFEPIESVVQLRDADEANCRPAACPDLCHLRRDGRENGQPGRSPASVRSTHG